MKNNKPEAHYDSEGKLFPGVYVDGRRYALVCIDEQGRPELPWMKEYGDDADWLWIDDAGNVVPKSDCQPLWRKWLSKSER